MILVFALSIGAQTVQAAYFTNPVPTNILYSDDFESYGTTTLLSPLGTGSNGGVAGGGWAFYDNGAGGSRNINASAYYSCCHSLALQSSTAASGKFDVHRVLGITPSITTVGISVWIAYNNNGKNEPQNAFTISIESVDGVNKHECVTFYYTNANDVNTGGIDHTLILSALNDTRNIYFTGQWHHFQVECNISTQKWVSSSVDGHNFPDVVGVSMNSVADSEPGTDPMVVRFEFAILNGGTHTLPTDQWTAWHDDIQITDDTPGTVACGANGSKVIVQSGSPASTTIQPGCITVVNTSIFLGVGLLIATAITGVFYKFGIGPFRKRFRLESTEA